MNNHYSEKKSGLRTAIECLKFRPKSKLRCCRYLRWWEMKRKMSSFSGCLWRICRGEMSLMKLKSWRKKKGKEGKKVSLVEVRGFREIIELWRWRVVRFDWSDWALIEIYKQFKKACVLHGCPVEVSYIFSHLFLK